MLRLSLLAVLLLAAAAPVDLSAQAPVTTGDRVRLAPNPVSPGERWLEGTVRRVSPDTVWLAVDGFAEDVWVPRNELTRVRRFAGRRSAGDRMARGMLTGALVGGGVGALLGAAAYDGDGCDGFCPSTRGGAAAFSGVLLAVPGAFLGALAGAGMPGEVWRDAAFARRSAGPDPVSVAPRLHVVPEGGVAVGATLRF